MLLQQLVVEGLDGLVHHLLVENPLRVLGGLDSGLALGFSEDKLRLRGHKLTSVLLTEKSSGFFRS